MRRMRSSRLRFAHQHCLWLVCLCCGIWVWSVGIYVGLGPSNFNDLLINQEFSKVGQDEFKLSSERHERAVELRGLELMRLSNVTFIGVAKNAGEKLPSVLRQINNLARQFTYSRAIFAQGDSTDGTTQLLNDWARQSAHNRTILMTSSEDEKESAGHFKGSPMPREGRIAKARNVALNALYGLPATEFVIVIDMDILGWSPNGVANSFGKSQTWDVMCAHGILLHGIYRDTYAFRTDGINTNHHWAGKDHNVYNISDADYKTFRQRLKTSQKRAREMMDTTHDQSGSWFFSSAWDTDNAGGKLRRVHSCFGGLAIYRFEKMKKCHYTYRYRQPPYMLECEHVLFHKCIAESASGRIFSNPAMKLWYGHSALATLSIKKVLSSISYA